MECFDFLFDLPPALEQAAALSEVTAEIKTENAETASPAREIPGQMEPGRSIGGLRWSQLEQLLWEKLGWVEPSSQQTEIAKKGPGSEQAEVGLPAQQPRAKHC